jgi:hypothetical protein
MSIRRLTLALGLGSCVALGGCGGSSPEGMIQLTEAQKAEKEARDRATFEAFKEHKKNAQKGGQQGQGRKTQVVNGVRTS